MTSAVPPGPPYIRATTTKGRGPVGTDPTQINGSESMRVPAHVYKHLDDLIQEALRVEKDGSLKRVLEDADTAAKQAETYFDFKRPDLGYQEHVKATVLALYAADQHPDSPSLKQDGNPLKRVQAKLMKRLDVQNQQFVKAAITSIKENNAQTGVRPIEKQTPNNGHARPLSVQADGALASSHTLRNGQVTNGNVSFSSPALETKAKAAPPAVPFKKENLVGKAISYTVPTQSSSSDPLAARLAQLRPNHVFPVVQDPRIRTQPLPTTIPVQSKTQSPAPLHSRKFSATIKPRVAPDLPSVPRPMFPPNSAPLDTHLPEMPTQPPAIYSPAPSDGNNNLASSISRRGSSFLRTNSALPVSSVGRTPGLADNKSSDYFSNAHSVSSSGQTPRASMSSEFRFPNSATVKADELLKYLKHGRILLFDLRNRDKFDEGHIMTPYIICVEPITLRRGISASDLEGSLVLSPDKEQKLFERRHEFDLIVYYDQCSTQIPTPSSSESYLDDFLRSIFEFDFEKQIKHRPMLLSGGLEAWVDLVGPAALQSSTTASASGKTISKAVRQPNRLTTLEDIQRGVASRTKVANGPKTIAAGQDSRPGSPPMVFPSAEDFKYVRTPEEFLRQYPEIPNIQSMMSPRSAQDLQHQNHNMPDFAHIPPTRPAPTLPRDRSNSTFEPDPAANYAMSIGSGPGMPSTQVGGLTGLGSYGAQCYVNSVTQCLNATPQFREFFLRNVFPAVPRRPNEKPRSPELSKHLQLLFSTIWDGKYQAVTPSRFWSCANELNLLRESAGARRPQLHYSAEGLFGKSVQHDVQETFSVLLELLTDELNPNRTSEPLRGLTNDELITLSAKPPYEGALSEWRRFQQVDNSFIRNVFGGQTVQSDRCDTCKYVSRFWTEVPDQLPCMFPQDDTGAYPPQTSLEALLDLNYAKVEKIEKRCYRGSCGDLEKGEGDGRWHTRTFTISYFPDYLVLWFKRFEQLSPGKFVKIHTHLPFTGQDMDLTKYALTNGTNLPSDAIHNLKGPFIYRPYGAIYHSGSTIKSGHYVAMARNLDKLKPAGDWHLFNDSRVTPCRPGSNTARNMSQDLTMLFLRRVPNQGQSNL